MLLATMALFANPVDKERADRVAKNAVIRFCAELHGIDTDLPVELTYMSPAMDAKLLHIYQYRHGEVEGFIIISGDDMSDPVLAFSDEGAPNLSNSFETNPAFCQQLKHYSNELTIARKAKASAPAHVTRKWKMLEEEYVPSKGDMYNDRINKLLGGMKWGQGTPYNSLCPRKAITGCVATAFGMIMNYWDYPEHGFGQHSYNGEDNPAAYPGWNYGELSADFEHTYYDWANMEDYAYINSPEEVKTAIGTLMFHIGVALDMRYGENASGCWSLPEYAIYDTSLHLDPKISAPYRIPKHFGYKFSYAGMRDSIGSDTLWMQMLYQSLADSMPIYYAGWERDSSDDGHSGTSGHGYILDGYFSDEVDSNLFHINWGWNGNNNGLFKLDAMTPSGYDFTQWHGAVIGLEPDTSYHGYDPAAIPMPSMAMPKVYSRNGHIMADGIDGQAAAVFDMMGRCIATRPAHQGNTWSLHVRPGIYVVRFGQLPAQKVIVINN